VSARRQHFPRGLELRRAGTLIERALVLLADGPASTGAVAASVLGMRGNPSAAASAVWTLLAGDERFAVSSTGIWSLRAGPEPTLPELLQEEWVVVDLETTGGTMARGHRVTEVAAVCVGGGQIQDVFASLVNPGRCIPRMIRLLTGITDEMVAVAPRFRQIAPQLADALRGRVFVAHNAAFDWRFLCAEMELATGSVPAGRQLCTVRLARKLLPQLRSRSLDSLARYFGLQIEFRHRARDDALATAHVLLRFLEMLAERGVENWAAVDALLSARAPRRRRRAIPQSMDSA
jgi:DNA polymerase III subunit epsilon